VKWVAARPQSASGAHPNGLDYPAETAGFFTTIEILPPTGTQVESCRSRVSVSDRVRR
jgi:hypothetical protein